MKPTKHFEKTSNGSQIEASPAISHEQERGVDDPEGTNGPPHCMEAMSRVSSCCEIRWF